MFAADEFRAAAPDGCMDPINGGKLAMYLESTWKARSVDDELRVLQHGAHCEACHELILQKGEERYDPEVFEHDCLAEITVPEDCTDPLVGREFWLRARALANIDSAGQFQAFRNHLSSCDACYAKLGLRQKTWFLEQKERLTQIN